MSTIQTKQSFSVNLKRDSFYEMPFTLTHQSCAASAVGVGDVPDPGDVGQEVGVHARPTTG